MQDPVEMRAAPHQSPPRTGTSVRLRLIGLAMLACLSACETPGGGPAPTGGNRQLAQAEKLSRDKQFAASAQQYEDIAAQSSAELRSRLLLRAAREWLNAGNVQRGETLLRDVGSNVAPADQSLRGMVGAQIALLNQRPDLALGELDRVPQPVSREDTPAFLELRSKALFAYGRPAGAVITAIDREQLLTDPTEVLRNRRMIWDGIRNNAAAGVDMQVPAGSSRQVAGWMELGRAALTMSRNPFAAQPAIDSWRARYPEHPANEFIERQIVPQIRTAITFPSDLALLLPLSGRQQAAGVAVRDGFLASLLQQPSDQRPTVRIYDTAANGVAAAYSQAAGEGAKFIVGPLLKEDVATLVQSQALSVPTLALNYPAEHKTAIPNLFLFSLDPEEEARQVAAQIAAAGLTHGIALLPNNDKGQRINRAFADELTLRGGSLVSTRFYDPAAVDFSAPVTTALLINESVARANAINAAVAAKLEFEPRARADVQFVFINAEPHKGRLLRPALRFHMREAVPVYASPEIFEPDVRANADLEGVLFPDMPWMIAPDEFAAQLRAALNQYWPGRARDRSRLSLYAFGFDAYRLAPLALSQSTDVPTSQAAGLTGRLTIDNLGRVLRELDWAKIVNGSPQVIKNPAAVSMSNTAPPPEPTAPR